MFHCNGWCFPWTVTAKAGVHVCLRRVDSASIYKALAEEGVTQVFRPVFGSDWIVGVVGALQLDVLKTRIQGEYKVEVSYEDAGYETARWVSAADKQVIKTFIDQNRGSMAEDRDENPVLLVRNRWELDRLERNFPDITFSRVRERS